MLTAPGRFLETSDLACCDKGIINDYRQLIGVTVTNRAAVPVRLSQGRIGEVYEHTTVVSQAYDESGSRLRVRGLPGAIAKLTQSFQE
ncbi:hypothetical protein [Corallococcus sicarius]|uniref:Uncharacterized protein n=1 Tax=Corallococcus sicarius TaxID=2316726 RepID=A0A3A8NES6_9BACT|nr:hypothetical protein [Corallococcus sicarius]RKH40721.1 hypothetical protein D7X12_20040 [Corallococcus sicarius]